MRKAKIAAMIFGGVSTCICGGILGVYSSTSTVGTAAPKNDVESIYDVQSEKLANVAAVTSIKTTAVTTTSKVPTTLSVVSDFSADEPIAEIYSVITTAAPIATTAETTVSNEIYADYAESIDDDETDNNDNVVYTASFGNLTISGPFIATEEPETTTAETEVPAETTTEVETEVPAETTTEVETEVPAETTTEVETEVSTETTTEVEEEFVFEPSTEYYPPAVEYIAPAPETIETTTTTTTTETTTSETTTAETTTVETTTEYVITTDEYTVPETTAEETTTTYETTTVETTTETTTAEVTTTEASTETTTTTEITTTTSETTAETTTTTDMVTIDVDTTVSSLPITDAEYVLLCNCVANEAGSDWIDVYEKGKVVEVIMNRVNSPLYPNTIYEVITAPYQFTGSENYAYLTTYSGYVTDMVQEAVDLYFNEPYSFTHNYFGFYGDGYQNHFY